jgi:hypothetical protein
MKHMASTVVPRREKPAYKLRTLLDRRPLYSQTPWRLAPITKIAGLLTAVIAFSFALDTILSGKFASDATTKSDFADPRAAHVVVNGLHIAIPNNLAHVAIDELIPLP